MDVIENKDNQKPSQVYVGIDYTEYEITVRCHVFSKHFWS